MKFLLDTHTLIWFFQGNDRLSPVAREWIEKETSTCFVSIVTLWEIIIKSSLGKLPLNGSVSDIEKYCHQMDMIILPIQVAHLEQLQTLELHHRDPFDRLLLAQAKAEKLTLLSKDENFI